MQKQKLHHFFLQKNINVFDIFQGRNFNIPCMGSHSDVKIKLISTVTVDD